MMPGSSIVSAALAAALLTAGSALAKDAVKSPSPALPGVETGYSIVKPVPEPDDPADQGNGGTRFKVGDTEVHVSGSITVDIGVGSIRAPRH
jgi:hypothetical protein